MSADAKYSCGELKRRGTLVSYLHTSILVTPARGELSNPTGS